MLDFADYVSGISFRFIRPHTRMPFRDEYYERRLEKILKKGRVGLPEKIGAGLEYLNTVFPEDDAVMKSTLRHITGIPKMSTLAVAGMINRGVAQMAPDEVFVNVGVWYGFTFLAGVVGNPDKKCVGVDNFSQFGGPRKEFLSRFEQLGSDNHIFHDMDYAEYFSRVHRDPIGFYIYDGGHAYEDQLRGLQLAEPYFSRNCIVLVDDTNWPEPRNATMDFIARRGDRYRVLLDVRTRGNCHPTVWNGVVIFQRAGGTK
ncbi:MAG: class I SAM-dependent methyltransferase [Desulfomonilaceae bacterium]|nr:class I SAM-dependent methyltransferase [Desulfomonilaceae bacterium]